MLRTIFCTVYGYNNSKLFSNMEAEIWKKNWTTLLWVSFGGGTNNCKELLHDSQPFVVLALQNSELLPAFLAKVLPPLPVLLNKGLEPHRWLVPAPLWSFARLWLLCWSFSGACACAAAAGGAACCRHDFLMPTVAAASPSTSSMA